MSRIQLILLHQICRRRDAWAKLWVRHWRYCGPIRILALGPLDRPHHRISSISFVHFLDSVLEKYPEGRES
jgi:hypothetical protein